MKIKLQLICYDKITPEFHFEKFAFCKLYYADRFVFSQTEIFNPARVCRRLEKYFPKFEFKSALKFDGYDSDHEFWYDAFVLDDEEDKYEDFYES